MLCLSGLELYSRWVPLTVGIIIKARGATLKITDLALLRFLSQWASACVPRSEKSFPAKLSIFVGIIIKASGATLKITDLALLRFLSQWASACVPRSEKSFPAKLSIFVGIIIKASGATLKVTDLIKGELQSVIVILFFVLTIAFQSDNVYMDL